MLFCSKSKRLTTSTSEVAFSCKSETSMTRQKLLPSPVEAMVSFEGTESRPCCNLQHS